MRLLGTLHRIVAQPRVYDLVQRMAGQRRVRAQMAPHLGALPAHARVLDLGGGTGDLWSLAGGRRYVCLDRDAHKLRGFRRTNPDGLAVVADATRIPFVSGSIGAVLCLKVVHHLDDGQLRSVVEEAARMLQPGGTLILSDAVWSPSRWISRALWAADRGSHPRTEEQIRSALSQRFSVHVWERFSLGIFHEFVSCVARPAEPDPRRPSS